MKYPEWWNKTLTIYNKSVGEDDEVKYIRRVVNNCFAKSSPVYSTSSDLGSVKNQTIVRIPLGDIIVNAEDIIIIGKIDDEIDEYTNGMRAADIFKKYRCANNAFTVKSVTVNNFGDLAHIKAEGC